MRCATRTLELLLRLDGRHLVALDDLARVEAEDEQLLGLLEQLAGKDDDLVRRVAHLCACELGCVRSRSARAGGRTSASCAWEAMTRSLAAGWTTSISRMIVAASEVTKRRPRWLMMSLLRPGETVRDVSAWGSVPRTIGTKACPDEVGELSYCLDIAQNGIVESLEVLRACEQESRHSAQSTHLVTLLEQFYVICFGDLERHLCEYKVWMTT